MLRGTLISSFYQLLGSQAVACAPNWFPCFVYGRMKLSPFPIPRIVGIYKLEQLFYRPAVIWLAFAPNHPLLPVVTIATLESQVTVTPKEFEFEEVHPLRPADVDLRHLTVSASQNAKAVVLHCSKIPVEALSLRQEL